MTDFSISFIKRFNVADVYDLVLNTDDDERNK